MVAHNRTLDRTQVTSRKRQPAACLRSPFVCFLWLVGKHTQTNGINVRARFQNNQTANEPIGAEVGTLRNWCGQPRNGHSKQTKANNWWHWCLNWSRPTLGGFCNWNSWVCALFCMCVSHSESYLHSSWVCCFLQIKTPKLLRRQPKLKQTNRDDYRARWYNSNSVRIFAVLPVKRKSSFLTSSNCATSNRATEQHLASTLAQLPPPQMGLEINFHCECSCNCHSSLAIIHDQRTLIFCKLHWDSAKFSWVIMESLAQDHNSFIAWINKEPPS